MRIAVALMLLGLAGCTTQQLADSNVSKLAPDVAPTYKVGYGDGCYTVIAESCSATGRGAIRRDILLIKTDREYAAGWNDGARACTCAGSAFIYIPLTTD